MAFNDWNNDGKIDFTDDFFEYQIYEESMKDSDNYIPSSPGSYSGGSSGGISTFGAAVASIGGLFIAALIVALLAGDNAENVPVIFTIILWIISSSVLAVFFDERGM